MCMKVLLYWVNLCVYISDLTRSHVKVTFPLLVHTLCVLLGTCLGCCCLPCALGKSSSFPPREGGSTLFPRPSTPQTSSAKVTATTHG